MNVKMEKIRELPVGAKNVFFDPRGNVLATWRCSMWPSEYVLQFWEIASGTLLKSIDLKYFVMQKGYVPVEACFTPDWKIFVVGCREGARGPEGPIHLIGAQTGTEMGRLPGHSSNLESITVSPDGNLVVSGSWNGEIKVWNLRSLQEVTTLKNHHFNVQALAFNPAGTNLASGSGTQLRAPPDIVLWDAGTWNKNRETKFEVDWLGARQRNDVTSLQFSPDGEMLAVGGGSQASYDVGLSILDGVTPDVLKTLMRKTPDVQTYACVIGVQFNPEGTLLFSGHGDGTIRIWDVNSGEKIEDVQEKIGKCVWGIALSPDGSMFATTSQSPGDLTQIWSLS